MGFSGLPAPSMLEVPWPSVEALLVMCYSAPWGGLGVPAAQGGVHTIAFRPPGGKRVAFHFQEKPLRHLSKASHPHRITMTTF